MKTILNPFSAVISLATFAGLSIASDIPNRLQATTPGESGQSAYYWKSDGVGETAQLLTLFCRSCLADNSGSMEDVPLVSILKDTLGDNDEANDRLEYVWLLTYSRPTIKQNLLSAVPFFYWRLGKGADTSSARDTTPLLDLTQPEHPVMSEMRRNLLQWTVLDAMVMPVRASSRAYRSNAVDYERAHLEEAISYLRQAPVTNDGAASYDRAGSREPVTLSESERNTVIARLELRKRLLGGLVDERRAKQLGEQDGFEQERIRSRNWELLRECAEKTGLLFEPIALAGQDSQYGILWFPLGQTFEDRGTPLDPLWKVLNIRNPWTDTRLKDWHGPVFAQHADGDGAGFAVNSAGGGQVKLAPLAVYSLNYPKQPLLLIDFRDKLRTRRHEMTQRAINELTAGVIGISHFTNWYYYVGADLYDFIAGRRGSALNAAQRLDCFSQFRTALALDDHLDPVLRAEMQRRAESLAINPLEASPEREIGTAFVRYDRLRDEADTPNHLVARLDKTRRAELATYTEDARARITQAALHGITFGLYTHRAREGSRDLAMLDHYRRAQATLDFLDSLTSQGTAPEIVCESSRIQASVTNLTDLMPDMHSEQMRAHAKATLIRVRDLSKDSDVQAECLLALSTLRSGSEHPAVAAVPSAPGTATLVAPVVRPPMFE